MFAYHVILYEQRNFSIAMLIYICFAKHFIILGNSACRPSLILGGAHSQLITHDLETGEQDYGSFSSPLTLVQVNSFVIDEEEGLFFFLDSDAETIYKKNL